MPKRTAAVARSKSKALLPEEVSKTRQALGDVSNTESNAQPTDAAKPVTTESRALRRSSRNSVAPSRLDPNPAVAQSSQAVLPAAGSHVRQHQPEDEPRNVARKRSSSQSLVSGRAAKRSASVVPALPPQPEDHETRESNNTSGGEPSSSSNHGQDDNVRVLPPAPRPDIRDLTGGFHPGQRRTAGRKRAVRPRSNLDFALEQQDALGMPPPMPARNPDFLATSEYRLQQHPPQGDFAPPFDARLFSPGIAPHDQASRHDPQEASEYVTDIFQRLFASEEVCRPTPYMHNQIEINAMMRCILVDWIIEVHMRFRLLPETLHLTINLIDRYLGVRQDVPRNELQLVGVTALLIACKYEEIYPPEVRDCVYVTDRAYTRQDVLDMEAKMVAALRFRLSVPTGHPFLVRFLHIVDATRLVRSLANFYYERLLQEYDALHFRPSLLAAVCVALALSNPDRLAHDAPLHEGPTVPQILMRYTGFSQSEMLEAAVFVVDKLKVVEVRGGQRVLHSVRQKFSSSRYDAVSNTMVLPHLRHLLFPEEAIPGAGL
eukprot:Nitzschia sp. Nitz4//scaffold45_size130396//68624//70480//NITZ4_003453-RA/size130396-snap-gene-0.126-mRNA-1//1//CDS//3329552410//4291//frame0